MFPNLEIGEAECDVGETGSGLDRNRPNPYSRSFVEAMEDEGDLWQWGHLLTKWIKKILGVSMKNSGKGNITKRE